MPPPLSRQLGYFLHFLHLWISIGSGPKNSFSPKNGATWSPGTFQGLFSLRTKNIYQYPTLFWGLEHIQNAESRKLRGRFTRVTVTLWGRKSSKSTHSGFRSLKEILYKKFPPPSDSPLLILILMNRGRVQGSEVGVSLGFGGSASQHLTLKPSTYGARI